MRTIPFAVALALVLGGVMSAFATGEAPPKDAKTNYASLCKGCHGESGKGDTKLGQMLKAPDFSAAKVQEALKDERIFKAIKEGLKKGDKVIMKPYADKLTDPEIKALVELLRSFKPKP